MKQVELPKFNVDKNKYFTWKAACMACIGSAHVIPEVEILQYLSGSAIKALEGLGPTKESYFLALKLLEESLEENDVKHRLTWSK